MKIKQLNKAYKKSIEKANSTFFTDKEAGLLLFVTHLRYCRDLLVAAASESVDKDLVLQTKVSTIAAAVAEFDAYCSSTDIDKKSFHLDNFFEITRQNMEEWLE